MSLSRVLTLSTAAVWGVMPDAIRNVLRALVRCERVPVEFHIALSTVGGPGTDRVARRLEAVLLTLKGVERAEVNGALGSIFVGGEPDSIDLEEVLSIIEEFDTDEDSDEDIRRGARRGVRRGLRRGLRGGRQGSGRRGRRCPAWWGITPVPASASARA